MTDREVQDRILRDAAAVERCPDCKGTGKSTDWRAIVTPTGQSFVLLAVECSRCRGKGRIGYLPSEKGPGTLAHD